MVEWQVSQLLRGRNVRRAACRWPTVPLWQAAQVPCTCVWSTRSAGRQAVVAWQDSQVSVVAMCVAFLPVAVVPLWQLEQPLMMPV